MANRKRTGKTARLTWVNRHRPFPRSLGAGITEVTDLLASAETFQKFDSTIVHILGSLSVTWIQVPVGTSSQNMGVAAYLYVADENLPLANFPDLSVETTQASYLWTMMREGRLARTVDGALVDTADDTVNMWLPITVEAQRKFRENNKTLWLWVKNLSGNMTVLYSCYFRTLIRIP